MNIQLKNCISFDDVSLKKHQKNVVKHILKTKEKGIVVFHSVGSGKTLTSIVAANCLMKNNIVENTIILTPVSVVGQFKKEIDRIIHDKELRKHITVSSHVSWLNKFKKGDTNAKNSLLIVDEVHKFKASNGERAKLLNKAAKSAKKILLLTATPSENSPNEIRNYMSMIKKTSFKKEYEEYEEKVDKNLSLLNSKKGNKQEIKSYLHCRFSYFKSLPDLDNFPQKTEHIIQLPMTQKYLKQYENIENNILSKELKDIFKKENDEDGELKNLSVFLNGLRRAVNKLDMTSPKINWVIKHIKSQVKQNKKVVVYSNWLKFGIKEIQNELDTLKISYGLITGSINKSQRTETIANYNKNNMKVLLITSAGAEGLDLKETRSLIVLEPYWHASRIDQVIGRAVRYKSHEKLPIKQRNVDVYHILLVKHKHRNLNKFQKKREKNKNKLSIDVILYNLSLNKRNTIDEFYDIIIKQSIENQKMC